MGDPRELVDAIRLPDGTPIRGRGRRQPLPAGPRPEFGLALGRRPRSPVADWPLLWVAWPDFGVPRDRASAAAAIRRTYAEARAGRLVEVTCRGGTGRTGTVLACLAVLAGHPADDAVAWVRRAYRPRAVETGGQARWVLWFAGSGN